MAITDTYGTYEDVTKTLRTTEEFITPGSGAPYQFNVHLSSYQAKWRIGSRNPRRYQQFLANSEATTAYYHRGRHFTYSPARATIHFRDVFSGNIPRTWTYEGDMLFNQIPAAATDFDASLYALAENRSLQSFVGKIRGKITSFQGGVAIGEARETFGMLRQPLGGIRRSLEQYVNKLLKLKSRAIRGKLRTAKLLEQAAETWLETSFGWKPFFKDVEDLCETLGRLGEKPPDRESVRSSGFAESQTTSIIEAGVAFEGKLIAELHRLHRIDHRFYGSVDCTPGGGVGLDSEKFGLGPENFLPTVWEVIPYSFLVDYFTNIGKIVDAVSLCSNRVKRIAWARQASLSYVMKGGRFKSPTDGVTHIETTGSGSSGRASKNCRSYQRGVYSGSLVPDFQWKIPTNVNQYINLASLAILRGKALPFKSLG